MKCITVAICTWNRAKLLDQTLTQMHELQIPSDVEWELLVVNNNCTDDTDAVIARHQGALPIRRLFEPRQGLSNARNCAVEAATGELILWTDDDVVVEEGWLSAYAEAACTWPEATYFGGPVFPWFEDEPPDWVREHLGGLGGTYALLDLGSVGRPFSAEEVPLGVNMAFRIEALRSHPFDVRLGRSGDKLISGDEVDMFRQLNAEGKSGRWVEGARLRHFVPASRMTAEYVSEWFRGAGRTAVLAGEIGESRLLAGVPRWAIRLHWTSRLASRWFAASRDTRWFKAFRAASYTRGIIEQSRRGRTAQDSP